MTISRLESGQLPAAVIKAMASRVHRMHHYLWHQTRNSWTRYPQKTRDDLAALGWAPPRVHQDWETNIVLDNNAGEDFLFMHRQMIRVVNGIWKKVDPKFPGLSGWSRLPEPGDPDYPVPPAYDHPDPFLHQVAAATKTDEYYDKKLLFWESTFRDPNFLRSITLGKLGSMIEATIHDAMHMRWSALPAIGIRPDRSVDGSTGGILGIDPKYDDPSYDFLADEYSAHVNPVFWQIHGWVDDRISDWMIVNGQKIGFHTTLVDPQWLGTWQGVLPTGHHGGHDDHGDIVLTAIADLARDAGEAGMIDRPGSDERAVSGGASIDESDPHSHHGSSDHDPYRRSLEQAVSIVMKSGVFHHMYARVSGR